VNMFLTIMGPLRRRWRRSGPLATFWLTIATCVAGGGFLAYGEWTGDVVARILGAVVSIFGLALVAMSLFVKLSRPAAVSRPAWPARRTVITLVFGVGGGLAFAYGSLSLRLAGRPAVPYGWLVGYGFLGVVLSFVLDGLLWKPSTLTASQRRRGWFFLALGIIMLATMVAAPWLGRLSFSEAILLESMILPFPSGIIASAWARIRGIS